MKILCIDIETTPNLVYTWGLFNQNINIEQIVQPSTILCFSAKWVDEKGIIFHSSRNGNFMSMLKHAHTLLNEADAVVHFNGNAFDIPILNQEFLRAKFKPTAPVFQIDLYRIVTQKFRLVSSKLAFVGPYFHIGEKVKHAGFELWHGCLHNENKAWRLMEKYNKQDTALMEPLYKLLLPWIDHHPNMALHATDKGPRLVCPNCGSDRLHNKGLKRCTTYVYRRFQCLACGKWSRERLSLKHEPKPGLIGT